MAAKQVLLTDEGLHNLEQELEFLKTDRRQEIAEQIKVALSHNIKGSGGQSVCFDTRILLHKEEKCRMKIYRLKNKE